MQYTYVYPNANITALRLLFDNSILLQLGPTDGRWRKETSSPWNWYAC